MLLVVCSCLATKMFFIFCDFDVCFLGKDKYFVQNFLKGQVVYFG